MAGPEGLVRTRTLDVESGAATPATAQLSTDDARDKNNMASTEAHIRTPSTQPSHSSTGGASEKPRRRLLLHNLKGHVPLPVRTRSRTVWNRLSGPDPPKEWKIRPFLPRLQHAPLRLADKMCPATWQRLLVFVIFCVCWIVTFGAVLRKSYVVQDINGHGQPFLISCGGTFWTSNNGCGLNGTLCLPFSNSSFAFRCPASCISQEVLNVRAVGAQDVIYETMVIGGPTVGSTADDASDFAYRGDSFICSAAIHAGVITNSQGGCGVATLIGQRDNYPSVTRNGISSIGFDSSFPQSFTLTGSGTCRDLQWQLLAVSVVYTTLLSLFARSSSVFFYSTVIGCFLQSALATAKPSNSDIATLVSTAIGNLLPALFISMVVYKLYIRKTLHGLTAQFEKTVLWLGPCWVGALADHTFELIPLSRLTAHDIRQEPGGLVSLIVIVAVLLVVFVGQAWAFRREGRMLRYIALYVGFGVCLGLLAAIPNEELRIHHYILGLLLIPGTSIQTRPSLVYQGILVGLFINGVARWGFDSIIQTAEELQGDALLGTVVPSITAANASASNITFTWPGVPSGYNGTSIIINDVERFRDYSSSQENRSFSWQRMSADEPEYFRFAFFALSAAYGLQTGDYTKAGTWFANGTWQQMASGST